MMAKKKAVTKKEAYVVLVGLKPGVYKKWLEASPHVTGVSKNQHQGFETFAEADEFYKRAQRNGETRTVTKSPSQDKEPQDEVGRHQDHRGGRQEQSRREQDSRPAASVQTPTSTLKGSSAGKAARDAQIAAALAGARKNRVGPSASSPSVIPSETSQSDKASRHAALARSATEPAYHLQPQIQSSSKVPESESVRPPPCPSSVRRTIQFPTLESELEPVSCTPETKIASKSCGSVSDISTYKTQTKNQFTNSPGLATPRYAQSLSYASSPSSLASSDLRTHLSSPSSCSTQYFPEDWLARHGRRRESNSEWREDDQSSVLSLSEYATAPNTPEQGSAELEDEAEAMRGGWSPSPSTHSGVESSKHLNSSSSAYSKARPKARSSAISPPAAPTKAISSPQRHTHPCACEHPEYACINCGQRPRIEPSSARSAAGQSRSSRAPLTATATASPAPSKLLSVSASSLRASSRTPTSAVPSSVRTRSSSSRSHGGGHTLVLGQSETCARTRSQSARIQESLGIISFSEAARGVGADAVVHDVSFDPRSPIQRGTSIPAGTSGSAVRPSPAMAPVPMGSLGLLFPPS